MNAPSCPHPDGHAWVSGRVARVDNTTLYITTRQCRRCGYEESLDPEAADG